METKVEKILKYTIVLSEEEATWLHGVMQNPLYGQIPEEENNYDKNMRQKFFNATYYPK